MPYYSMNCQKAECQHSEDMLMKYDEMKAGVKCPVCQGDMFNKIAAVAFKPAGGGHSGRMIFPNSTSSSRRATPKNVGPLAKDSLAYEKKMDDANSSDAHKPGGTFGSGGAAGFKKRQETIKQMDEGNTNFTK